MYIQLMLITELEYNFSEMKLKKFKVLERQGHAAVVADQHA